MSGKVESSKNEKKIKFLNDLIATKEEKPLDIFDFQITTLSIDHDFRKHDTLDLIKKTRKFEITPIPYQPKIRILRLKRPMRDLVKVKKNRDVIANFYAPIIDENTINLLFIEEYYQERGPFPDLIRIHFSKWKKFKISLKKSLRMRMISLKHVHLQTVKHEQDGMVEIVKTKKTRTRIRFHVTWGYVMIAVLLLGGAYVWGVLYLKDMTLKQISALNVSISNSHLKEDLKEVQTNAKLLQIALKIPFTLNSIVGNQQMKNFQNVLVGLDDVFQVGIQSINFYQGVHALIEKKGIENIMFAQMLKNKATDDILKDIVVHFQNAQMHFSEVNNLGNVDLNQIFFQKREALKKINDFVQYLYVNKDSFYSMLGADQKRTYLIIFQNSDEIRPTGGFMGSVGILSMFNGQVTNFEKKDIYALEWLMKDHKNNGVAFNETPPPGLSEITDTFGLRDANYYYEIPESSKKISEFLTRVPLKIDGIIYINQNLVLDILKHYGGLYFEPAKQEINADNFSMMTSTLVESKISKTDTLSTPKQVMFDFIEAYMQKLKLSKDYIPLFSIFQESLKKRDIIISPSRLEDQEILKPFLSEYIPNRSSSLDFTYPVFTSLSGNKSDRYVNRTFSQKVTTATGCNLHVTFTSEVSQIFAENDAIQIRKVLYDIGIIDPEEVEKQLLIQGKGSNKSYVRVLIPQTAQIVQKPNIKMISYPSYKEVSYTIETNPQEKSVTTFEYDLPNPSCQPYTYHFYKQPGIPHYTIGIEKDSKQMEFSDTSFDTTFQ